MSDPHWSEKLRGATIIDGLHLYLSDAQYRDEELRAAIARELPDVIVERQEALPRKS